MKKLDKKIDDIYKEIESFGENFSSENIMKLISFFGHPEWAVRKKAVEIVVSFGEKVIPNLSQTIFLNYSLDDDTLYWCIYCSGKIGGSGIKTILLPLLESEKISKNNKVFVIRALGNVKEEYIIDLLINNLSDSSWNIRKEAADQLQNYGEMIIPKLKKSFSSGNKDVRYWSVKILGHILGDDSINFFKKMLKSDNKDIRYYATAALGEIKNDDSLAVLTELFSDDSWLVRAQVADIFEKLGSKSVKYLKQVFEKGNSDARFQVIKLMGKIMGGEATTFIEKIFNSNEPEMKFYAMSALAESNEKSSISLIISRFSDDVWLVRKHASETLAKMGEIVIPALEEILEKSFDDNMKHWAIVALCNLGELGNKTINKFGKGFSKKDKITLIENSNIVNNMATIDRLFELIEDREWPVRNCAYKKLSENFKHIKDYIPYKFLNGNSDSRFWLTKIAKDHSEEIIDILVEKLEIGEIPPIEKLKLKIYTLILIFSIGANYSYRIGIEFFEEGNEECEYFFDVLETENIINKEIFEIILKITFNSEEDISKDLTNFIEKNLFNFSDLIKEKIVNDYMNFYPILDLIAKNKSDKALKLLTSFLSIENLDVKSNILSKIASFGTLESLFTLLNFLEEADEKEKMILVSTNNENLSKSGIKLIVEKFRMLNDEEAIWILKLLINWGENHKEYLMEILSKTKDPKIEKWLSKVVQHQSGRKFIE